MRKIFLISLVVLLAAPLTARNKAVLIGVSNYPEGSGWCRLNAHNDVMLLDDLLSPSWDVQILEDSQATHKGIVSLISRTVRDVSPGDTVLIHFSGHGQQMLPIVKDAKYDPDFLDEAIIPYDAKKDWSPTYTGQNHLRDNEFGVLIDDIRSRIGIKGLVLVVLDACHSDSMEREPDKEPDTTLVYRGTSDIFGQNVTHDDELRRFNRDTSIIEVNNNATVVYISACQANSRNAEILSPDGTRYGSLSYAVAGALSDGGIKDLKAFLDRVVKSMDALVPYQTPGIRASFDYQRPAIPERIIKADTINEESQTRPRAYPFVFVIALAALIVAIWRMKRK